MEGTPANESDGEEEEEAIDEFSFKSFTKAVAHK